MKRRKYELRRRAESQEETRRRIVEAIVDLHESVGPRATTISAIADKAGVQRLTVYRHFPDEPSLFLACSSHWLAQHPLPDPVIWRSLTGWRARCRASFGAVFAYFRQNRGMLSSVFRDADLPAMQVPMQGFAGYFESVHNDLVASAEPALFQNRNFEATISHALSFATWDAFADRFNDSEMVELAMTWLEGVAAKTGS